MDYQLKKSIIYDVLDGIPSSANEKQEVISYRKAIEHNYLILEVEAMNLGMSKDVIEFTEDFRQIKKEEYDLLL